jgi:hypothetical protein
VNNSPSSSPLSLSKPENSSSLNPGSKSGVIGLENCEIASGFGVFSLLEVL